MLASLVRYYDAMAAKGKMPLPGYGPAKVSYALALRESGELYDVIPLAETVRVGKKDVERPRILQVPEPVVRTVGVLSNFLCDNSGYFLGCDSKGKPERSRQCFDAAKTLHLKVLDGARGAAARAVSSFFQTWKPEGAAEHPALKPYWEGILKGGNLIFWVAGGFAQDDPEILDRWESHRGAAEQAALRACLVTGEHGPVARLHPKIKGVRDAQSSGASIVSFNAPAFESYGNDGGQGLNAPIGERAAFAYTTALNALLADPKHRAYLGDMTVVFWSEDGNEAAAECFQVNLGVPWQTVEAEGPEKEERSEKDERPETPVRRSRTEADRYLHDVFTRLERGLPLEGDVDVGCPFCVLALAPNASRLSIRFFLRDSFGSLVQNIQAHYGRLALAHAPFEPEYLLFSDLMDTLAHPNEKVKSPPHLLAGALLRDVLRGSRYPAGMYATALMRIRARQQATRPLVALLKAYLLRNSNDESTREVCSMALNEDCVHPAYVLGRLFSLLEKAQEDANPGINATIKDRYFNAACATPGIVFPTLLKLTNHHLRKLDTGWRISLEKQIGELTNKLEGEPFPSRQDPEEQGLFILGYYHQTQARYVKKTKEGTKDGAGNQQPV
ncbi:MAG TPA: type I-C CRISPR-associated protein Cas8c/Csd1 [Clostridia bacterium]|nr:type I-C CRISPR-associated protein Cas8c/Csd1 [Clostridia bacterium]